MEGRKQKPSSAWHTIADVITDLDKGLGPLNEPTTQADPGWRLLDEDICLPAAVLYDSTIRHNLQWMQQFVDAYGLKLAPHGKTTMAPKLFQRQLDAGAWGITVATAQQALVAARHGVKRVLMANQLIGRRNIEIVAGLLAEEDFDFFCLVDSPASVERLGRFFAARPAGAARAIQVLLEIAPTREQGHSRTGVRDDAQLASTLAALTQWQAQVRLAGVEIYEGVLQSEPEIRAFLRRAVDIAWRIESNNGFSRESPILSGAGSAWYDVVAEEFAAVELGRTVDVVLRPGCYLTHDVGAYQTAQDRILRHNPVAARMREGLRPALHLWAYVQSVPDADQAVIAFGKRDASSDAGFPRPALHHRPGLGDNGLPTPAPPHWQVTRMMDQHAYLSMTPGDDLRVGDMIAFDISHPCLTFDKWRQLLVVDDDYRCIDIVQTFF